MHTLLIHQAFTAGDEAGGTRHFELGSHLVASGHEFTVVASDVAYLNGKKVDKPRDEQINGLRVLRARTLAGVHKSYLWRVVSFLSFMTSAAWTGLTVRRIDLVMGTSPPLFQALSAWLVSVIRRKPFLLEIRDLWPEFAIDIGLLKNPVLIWLARRLEHFLYARATHLLVNSPAYREYLIAHGIAPSKVSFIPNGVDTGMFADQNPAAANSTPSLRQEFSLEQKFIVTYAGALGMANDIDTILDAAVLLAKSRPEVQLLFVGDGKERPRLEARVQELGLANVTFAGSRPKSQMPSILAESDACLATLKDIPMFRTTYPNKVFDYMAAARPTILAIDGVIRDVVEAAGGGVFTPPGQAGPLAAVIERLASNPAAARAQGLAAQRYVRQHFDRSIQAVQFVELVNDLAAGRKPRTPDTVKPAQSTIMAPACRAAA